jgi:polyketide synthase PksJ
VTARTSAAVHERLRDLSLWLRRNGAEAPASALAYTLSCGRSRFEEGYLLAFQNPNTLSAAVDAAMAGRETTEAWLLSGRRSPSRALHDTAARLWDEVRDGNASRAEIGELAEMIVQGYWPEWQDWFTPAERRRLALPTYPFQTESCWLTRAPTERPTPLAAPADAAAARAATPHGDGDAALESARSEVLAILSQELGLPAADIDPQAPLSDYGMESVKAMSLRFLLEKRLGVDVSIQQIVGADTAERLAQLVLAAPQTPGEGTSPADDLSEASDEQLVALFEQFSTNGSLLPDADR